MQNDPTWGTFCAFRFAGSLWHKDRWLPCTERIYFRRPYAIKPGYISLQGGGQAGGGSGVKWTDEEVDMLHSAVRTFAEDLQTISETIKQRTVIQIKSALKKKVSRKLLRLHEVTSIVYLLHVTNMSHNCDAVTMNDLHKDNF